jgi:PiT family inorganic phosphate transporter
MLNSTIADTMAKYSISKDLKQLSRFDVATTKVMHGNTPVAVAVLFLAIVFGFVGAMIGGFSGNVVILTAAVIGGYMALNIGANDVANNVGPAVGSKAITLGGAIIIAAIFESAGALLAGGDVTSTIKKGIINPDDISNTADFVMLMLAALLAAALWLNLATYISAPVSTTHSIVGGVMGSGIAAAGFAIVNWPTMGMIAASWVISPVLGGIVAALFFALIRHFILSKKDKLAAAQTWVPIMVGVMGAVFSMYLMTKGIKKLHKFDASTIYLTGAAMFIGVSILTRPIISKATKDRANNSKSVNKLFTIPLIFSCALLSFAHGANDVANAIGPLAAIVDAVDTATVHKKVDIPMWVMVVGAVGIVVGLALFGAKVIRTVGNKITKIDEIRAYCMALSAAITVIIASAMGLPVSSTHITVGAVFGVGLYREISSHRSRKKGKKTEKLEKRKLVRRKYIVSIALAWVVTVPASALLSAGIFLALKASGFATLID